LEMKSRMASDRSEAVKSFVTSSRLLKTDETSHCD
jgi:hypothetical protein